MNQLISIAAIIAVLSVGYMHRKQMRQNEARNLDPSLPIKPPPSAFTVWFIQNLFIFLSTIPLGGLVFNLLDTAPITRGTIFFIAGDVATLMFLVGAHMNSKAEREIYKQIIHAFEVIARVSDAHIGFAKTLADGIAAGRTDPPEQR